VIVLRFIFHFFRFRPADTAKSFPFYS